MAEDTETYQLPPRVKAMIRLKRWTRHWPVLLWVGLAWLVAQGLFYSRASHAVWGIVDYRNVRVLAKESGILKEVDASVGGAVRRGQILASVDSDRIRYEIAAVRSSADRRRVDADRELFRVEQRIESESRELEARQARERAERELLVEELDRMEELFGKRLIDQSAVVEMRTRLSVLESSIESLSENRKELEEERARIAELRQRWRDEGQQHGELAALLDWEQAQTLLAPCDATVLRVDAQQGDFVQEGDSVLELLADEAPVVRGFAPLSSGLDLIEGREVFLRGEGLGRTVCVGRIAAVNPSVESLLDTSNPIMNRSIRGRFFQVACDGLEGRVEGERLEIHFKDPSDSPVATLVEKGFAMLGFER
ncbi:HlyD family efflux transporter periplasmic adaptor subunit [Pelagicoccus sp. SDUM812003]|uniref:HlyD family secretion protein n=1 Tax=Pelagicoccus sp. SDUM812003 TaxID=3041267 RepID=UPI00280D37E3|nr:HlyD family efflux transporter periplasmic adaptor subunit [Pelagicoccus sp. SDUM812003]MDQ8202838.1 HlyD family efflux transporter periplasmic adaptor subunit [Pelagicoccus sp. SDUM812003]